MNPCMIWACRRLGINSRIVDTASEILMNEWLPIPPRNSYKAAQDDNDDNHDAEATLEQPYDSRPQEIIDLHATSLLLPLSTSLLDNHANRASSLNHHDTNSTHSPALPCLASPFSHLLLPLRHRLHLRSTASQIIPSPKHQAQRTIHAADRPDSPKPAA
jgi:hypothetical protein